MKQLHKLLAVVQLACLPCCTTMTTRQPAPGRALIDATPEESENYIDIRVVAKDSPEGVVRHVRAYPDGRVDAKPWAAHAQMGPP